MNEECDKNHAQEKRTGVIRGNVYQVLPDLEIPKD